jgi:hypothetical protein
MKRERMPRRADSFKAAGGAHCSPVYVRICGIGNRQLAYFWMTRENAKMFAQSLLSVTGDPQGDGGGRKSKR